MDGGIDGSREEWGGGMDGERERREKFVGVTASSIHLGVKRYSPPGSISSVQ